MSAIVSLCGLSSLLMQAGLSQMPGPAELHQSKLFALKERWLGTGLRANGEKAPEA